jgi:type VI secretion system secreted protein VgrG
MADTKTNDVRATFSITGLSDTLHVLEFHGEEAISSLFQFRIDLAAESDSLSFSTILGKPALLTITGEKGPRYVHGMVAAFQQREKARKFTIYHAVVVPKVWKLTQRKDCRIFQKQQDGEKNAKEIVTKVLKEVLSESELEFKLKNNQDPPDREYCVQYRESDWAFVSRLLEEEGICYFFEHSQDKHVLKLRNDYQLHSAIASEEKVPFRAPGHHGISGQEHITRFFLEERLRAGKVTLQDWNFKKPSVNLKSERPRGEDIFREIYDYPGEYTTTDEGGELAQIRLEELRVQWKEAEGDSDCVRLVPGSYFRLTHHDKYGASENDKYTITWIRHDGTKSGDLEAGAADTRIRYENSFRCLPRKVVFRPPRLTPRPFVHGVQTAIVTGPKTEEIYTDEYGRVKVHFHWDRLGKMDENSSCWIRASQAWAGQGWGAVHLPRIGHEVIVDFLEGDPDRPVIVGRVYHGENPPPYSLPSQKTKSTVKSNSSLGGKGYNELRYEDKKGKEEVFLHAQRSFNENILHNMSTSVGGDQSISVSGDQSIHVEGVQTLTVEGKKGEPGKHGSMKVTGDITIESTNDIKIACPAKLTLDVDGTTVVMTPGTMDVMSGGGASLTLSETDVTICGDKIQIVGMASTQVAGLTFLASGTGKADLMSTGPTTISGTPVQLNGPGPYCGRVTELAVATITTGAALVLVGGASFPYEVRKLTKEECAAKGLPEGTLLVGEHITIQPGKPPNSQFQNKVLRDLGIMSSTTSGKSRLENIQNNAGKHDTTIREWNDADIKKYGIDNSTATPTNPGAGNSNYKKSTWLGLGGPEPGSGSGTEIAYNPDVKGGAAGTDEPADATLFHEMGHAEHNANGVNLRKDKTGDGWENKEEQQNIDGGINKPGGTNNIPGTPRSYSENEYLDDRGYPYHRTDHGSTWVNKDGTPISP